MIVTPAMKSGVSPDIVKVIFMRDNGIVLLVLFALPACSAMENSRVDEQALPLNLFEQKGCTGFRLNCNEKKMAEEAASINKGELSKKADEMYENGQYSGALQAYSKLARIGDKFSQYRLAMMYDNGLGAGPDIIEAYAWLSVAAEYFYDGFLDYWMSLRNRIPEDQLEAASDKSIDYYRKYSDIALSHRLDEENYIARNGRTGVKRIEQMNSYVRQNGARRYIAKYPNRLAMPSAVDALFAEGKYEDAFLLYLNAAKRGDEFAAYRTSYLYSMGLGTAKNMIEAYAWAVIASEFGSILYVAHRENLIESMNPLEIEVAQSKVDEYYAKYGLLALIKSREKELRSRKFSCTGSRVGNSCDRLRIQTCSTPGICRTEPGFVKAQEVNQEMRKLENLTTAYIKLYGRVILGEFEVIGEDVKTTDAPRGAGEDGGDG